MRSGPEIHQNIHFPVFPGVQYRYFLAKLNKLFSFYVSTVSHITTSGHVSECVGTTRNGDPLASAISRTRAASNHDEQSFFGKRSGLLQSNQTYEKTGIFCLYIKIFSFSKFLLSTLFLLFVTSPSHDSIYM